VNGVGRMVPGRRGGRHGPPGPQGPLTGTLTVPGDKSISHRAAILAAMAGGRSRIRGFSPAWDCRSTRHALISLGAAVRLSEDGAEAVVEAGPFVASGPLDCGRSGTTMRLLSGVLAAAGGRFELTGDEQLLRRPMERVAVPLRRMGARVETTAGRPPLAIEGGALRGIEFALPMASAQVKSAVLLAALSASGPTTVIEPAPSRDHTERLLAWLGVPVSRPADGPGGGAVTVRPAGLQPFDLEVPGDLSSAAPLLAAAAMVPGSDVTIEGVGLNPGRTGFLDVLARMGAAVEVSVESSDPEPAGRVRVRHAPLCGVRVEPAEVPRLVDELPLIGLVATAAEGTTVVGGAAELRVKESDRIAGLVDGLRGLGAEAEAWEDGFAVTGPAALEGGTCDALGDHRLVMAFAVAGLVARSPVVVRGGVDRVGDSFPGFHRALAALAGGEE
jgi:3-phosphoshikimate 1-carboxyvinyltransferase